MVVGGLTYRYKYYHFDINITPHYVNQYTLIFIFFIYVYYFVSLVVWAANRPVYAFG